MRLLLTRAADDSARTRAKLEAAGNRVLVSPVIEIAATGNGWPDGVIDGVLATSGQPFAVMEDWSAVPAPEARRLVPLFLVGDRTAEVARLHGFSGEATIAANAAALAIAIGRQIEGRTRILYLAGRDRKPDIETALDVVGHAPEIVEIYEACEAPALRPDVIDAIWSGAVGTVLHFSRRSAGLFVKLASDAGCDIRLLRHLCLSDDVAVPLVEAGCQTITTAEAPNETALLALVDRL